MPQTALATLTRAAGEVLAIAAAAIETAGHVPHASPYAHAANAYAAGALRAAHECAAHALAYATDAEHKRADRVAQCARAAQACRHAARLVDTARAEARASGRVRRVA